MADEQAVEADRERRPDDLGRQRLPNSGRVTSQDVALRRHGLLEREPLTHERAEPGRDAVDHVAALDRPVESLPIRRHPLQSLPPELDPGTVDADRPDPLRIEPGSRERDGAGHRQSGSNRSSSTRLESNDAGRTS
jgi:hypothetical protein